MDIKGFPLLKIERHRIGVDGQGVTSLVAGAGCPLSCKYCLNKEILSKGQIKDVSVDELYDMVKIDDLYFKSTNGGITFGGGESLLHYKFISEFSQKYGKDWNITVETSLYVPVDNILESLGYIDNYIVDCKTLNAEIYRKYTGHSIDLMFYHLKLLLGTVDRSKIVVRMPLIPNYNDEEQQEKDIQYLKSIGVENIDKFNYIIR